MSTNQDLQSGHINMMPITGYSWLSAITWKRVLIAVLLIAVTSYAITLKIDSLTYQKDLKALERDKQEALDNRETELNTVIENQLETIELNNATIDSFDIALTLKDIQLDNLHNDVQILAGDSIGILNALNRVFTK